MKKLQSLVCGVLLSCLLGLDAQAQAQVQGIALYAAAGVKSPIENILEAFSKESGQSFDLHFDTAGAAQKQFLADAHAQILITTQERIEHSQSTGELKRGEMIMFAATMAGIASSLQPLPVIQTKEDLKAVLLGVKSIAFSDPDRGATVGLHFVKIIKTLGIEKEVLAKARKAREGLQTMQWVKEGQVELGVTQVSEIMQADPKSLVGPFPQEFDLSTRYALWLNEPDQPIMKRMLTWLKSEHAKELMKAQGLRPLN